MKVLHVISDENIGGAGVLLTSLLRNFDAQSIQNVVALPKNSQLIGRVAKTNAAIRKLEYPCDGFCRRSVCELMRLINRDNIEIVHANAALCARMAGKLCGVPVVHTRHCCYPPSGVWKYGVIQTLGGVWNRMLSDCVIATADAAAVDLQRLGIPASKIKVIINGSEPIREVSADELHAARLRWGISKHDFVVGICARLEGCKGHETFLRAAKLICESIPHINFRFLIVGTGSLQEKLKTLCRKLELCDRVCFTGFVQDMAIVYRLLRVNVNCSCGTETSCLALSEGMSAGVPMVISDYGGNLAMLGDSNAGFSFPVGDAEALCRTVCRIASDPVLEQQMRAAALERYKQCYTAKKMTDEVMRVYERLCRSDHSRR